MNTCIEHLGMYGFYNSVKFNSNPQNRSQTWGTKCASQQCCAQPIPVAMRVGSLAIISEHTSLAIKFGKLLSMCANSVCHCTCSDISDINNNNNSNNNNNNNNNREPHFKFISSYQTRRPSPACQIRSVARNHL